MHGLFRQRQTTSESRGRVSALVHTRNQPTGIVCTGVSDDHDIATESGLENSVASFGDFNTDLGYGVAAQELGYGDDKSDLRKRYT
jgi:hypothetical protein